MPVESTLDTSLAFDSNGIPSESDWEMSFGSLMLPGVLAGEPSGTTVFTTEFQVYGDSSGRQVKVRAGRCMLFGHAGENESEVTLAIDAADGSNPRYDVVVLRLDRTNNRIALATKTGTAAVSPAVPGLTQTSLGVYEVLLATVYVDTGATTIASGDVTDRRVWAIPDLRGWPTARVRRATDQTSVGSGSNVTVTMDTATLVGGFRWTAGEPTKLYFPRPGVYRVLGRLRWSANATGVRQVQLTVNGSLVSLDDGPVISGAETTVSTAAQVSVGDSTSYVELVGFQNSGSSLTYESRAYAPLIEAELIRPTTLY